MIKSIQAENEKLRPQIPELDFRIQESVPPSDTPPSSKIRWTKWTLVKYTPGLPKTKVVKLSHIKHEITQEIPYCNCVKSPTSKRRRKSTYLSVGRNTFKSQRQPRGSLTGSRKYSWTANSKSEKGDNDIISLDQINFTKIDNLLGLQKFVKMDKYLQIDITGAKFKFNNSLKNKHKLTKAQLAKREKLK